MAMRLAGFRFLRVGRTPSVLLTGVLLIGVLHLTLGGPAHAQPTLEFANSPPLKLTLDDKEETPEQCPRRNGEQAGANGDPAPELRSTKATAWVRYADSAAPLEEVRFYARAKANSSGDTADPWKGIFVCWHRVGDGQDDENQGEAIVPFEIFIEVQSPPESDLPEWGGWVDLAGHPKRLGEYWKWFWHPSLPYEWSSLSGYLTVTAEAPDGDPVPGVLALQLISPAQGYSDWFWLIVRKPAFYYFVFALVAGLVLVLVLPEAAWSNFRKELDFDMKAGWASNLTTAGAVLGTLLSAGLLPDDPFFMAKAQYTALNVVFVLALLLAYLLYRLLQRGFVLLLAGAVVLGAAAGELATVCLLLYEISFRGVLPPQIVPYIQIALVASGLMVTGVAGQKLVEALGKGKAEAEDKALVRSFYDAWAQKVADKRNAAFDGMLHPSYGYRDRETGETLGPEEVKESAARDHARFRGIRFDVDDQSSGEGAVSSRVTMRATPKAGVAAARNADGELFLDICRVEGGVIRMQWTKKLPSPAPKEGEKAIRRRRLKRRLRVLGQKVWEWVRDLGKRREAPDRPPPTARENDTA